MSDPHARKHISHVGFSDCCSHVGFNRDCCARSLAAHCSMVVRMTASAGSPAARKKKKATQMEYGCLGKNVIMPASPFKITWDILCVGLLLYAVVITPLKIGFGIEEHCPDGSWVFDVIVDAIFLFDCGLNFFTAAWIKDHFGELKVSGRMDVIAKTYLKSWFIVDFSSSVPVDAVM